MRMEWGMLLFAKMEKELLRYLNALPLRERERAVDELLGALAKVLDDLKVLRAGGAALSPLLCRQCPFSRQGSG